MDHEIGGISSSRPAYDACVPPAICTKQETKWNYKHIKCYIYYVYAIVLKRRVDTRNEGVREKCDNSPLTEDDIVLVSSGNV